jgi:hypothetical protein
LALAKSYRDNPGKLLEEYYKNTKDLRLNILIKNLKAPFMYNKELRHLALRSGLLSIDIKNH